MYRYQAGEIPTGYLMASVCTIHHKKALSRTSDLRNDGLTLMHVQESLKNNFPRVSQSSTKQFSQCTIWILHGYAQIVSLILVLLPTCNWIGRNKATNSHNCGILTIDSSTPLRHLCHYTNTGCGIQSNMAVINVSSFTSDLQQNTSLTSKHSAAEYSHSE